MKVVACAESGDSAGDGRGEVTLVRSARGGGGAGDPPCGTGGLLGLVRSRAGSDGATSFVIKATAARRLLLGVIKLFLTGEAPDADEAGAGCGTRGGVTTGRGGGRGWSTCAGGGGGGLRSGNARLGLGRVGGGGILRSLAPSTGGGPDGGGGMATAGGGVGSASGNARRGGEEGAAAVAVAVTKLLRSPSCTSAVAADGGEDRARVPPDCQVGSVSAHSSFALVLTSRLRMGSSFCSGDFVAVSASFICRSSDVAVEGAAVVAVEAEAVLPWPAGDTAPLVPPINKERPGVGRSATMRMGVSFVAVGPPRTALAPALAVGFVGPLTAAAAASRC